MNKENFLRKQIQIMLNEQEQEQETPKPSIRSVGVGRGGWKGNIKDAGALAKKNPSKLMKNLKVSDLNKKSEDLDLLQDLLQKASSGTDEMKNVFSYKENQPTARDPKGNVLKSVTLQVKTVSPRDAQKYIEHTIVGATSAFSIDWSNKVEITKSGNNIVVYLK